MNAHMPFLNSNAIGVSRFLCARASSNTAWKIHAERDGLFRIQTGVPDDVTECAPTFYDDNDRIRVSFIAGASQNLPAYRAYRLYCGILADNWTLADVRPIETTAAGFVSAVGVAYIRQHQDRMRVHLRTPDALAIIEAAGRVYRVSYAPDHPRRLLLSGAVNKAEYSIEYDIDTDQQQAVICDGGPAYKFATLGDVVQYARRVGPGFEDREIVTAQTVERIPTDLFRRIQ